MTSPSVSVGDLPDPLPADLHVIDVREPGEWDAGHVPGSLHFPLQQLPDMIADLPSNGRYLMVCKVGGRSANAADWLADQGADVLNLQGGLLEWEAVGRPLVSETGAPAQIV